MVQARALETRDIWAVAKILRSCQPEVMAAIEQSRRRADGTRAGFGEIDWEELGLPLVFSLLEQADTNLRALLASIGEMSPAELDAQPPADTVELIGLIVGMVREDAPRFLEPLSKMLAIRAVPSTSLPPATAGASEPLAPLRQPSTSKRQRAAS